MVHITFTNERKTACLSTKIPCKLIKTKICPKRYRTPRQKTTDRMRKLIESQQIESKIRRHHTSKKDNSLMMTTHRYKLK